MGYVCVCETCMVSRVYGMSVTESSRPMAAQVEDGSGEAIGHS